MGNATRRGVIQRIVFEMAISFSRPDPSSPAAVSAASFNVSRRGFDQTEVRDFLRMVSAEMARLQERERFLESELKAMQTRGLSAPGMLDEEVVTALLGEEAARVLGTAREASSQIRLRAEEAATRLVKEASSDATRLREEAELEAVRRREDAAADAEAEIELAKQQGRDMVNEAREYREKVLTELARRRELAREQIEQLIHNRDRLLNAFERARLATDDVMTGLVSVDHDLPREYINLAPTTGPVPTIVLERVVEAFAEAEVEVEEPEVIELFDHTKLEEIESEATQEVVEEIVEEIVDVVIDVVAVVEEETPTAEVRVEVEVVEEIPVVEAITEETPVVEVVEITAVTEDEKSNVVNLFSKERPRPETSGGVNPEHPSVDKAVAPKSDANAQAVDNLFARLREATVDKAASNAVSGGKVVEPRKSTKKIEVVEETATTVTPVQPMHDAGAFAKRDEVLAPIVVAMSRKLKRVLADEENEVLEYLRGKKNTLTLDAMVGEQEVHAKRYGDAISEDIMAAAKGAAKSAKVTDVIPTVDALIGVQLVKPLRDRLAKAIEQNGTDRVAMAKALRGVYRQWKSQHIDEQVDDIACLSYSRGFFAGVKPGTQVCWMVDPNGPECPDAEDNSLAGSIALGKEFPTGNLHPLAHAGCRCLLAPVQQ
jgi:DivIVA domain-containing protein